MSVYATINQFVLTPQKSSLMLPAHSISVRAALTDRDEWIGGRQAG